MAMTICSLMTEFTPYQPSLSINYITSHDGFTLYDLAAYNEKRNWVNGHNNADGANDFSWNCGWEGDTDTPVGVMHLRKQQIKNFVCLLLLSNGTPMFRMGDEFMQTQGGNNNPYNIRKLKACYPRFTHFRWACPNGMTTD